MICWGPTSFNKEGGIGGMILFPGGLGSPGLGGRGLHWVGGNAYLNYSREVEVPYF